MSDVQVTQEDRDAASNYIEPLNGHILAANIRLGLVDGHMAVQAFARFEQDVIARVAELEAGQRVDEAYRDMRQRLPKTFEYLAASEEKERRVSPS